MCVFFRVFPFRRICFLFAPTCHRVARLHLFTSSAPLACVSVRILTCIRRSCLDNSPTMNTLARHLLTVAPLALVAACSSAPPPQAAANAEPMIYVSSARSPTSIANCLEDRLARVHESTTGNATELSIGSSSDASYFVTLTPSGYGSVIRVTHGASRSDDPPEPELRFDVARCTT